MESLDAGISESWSIREMFYVGQPICLRPNVQCRWSNTDKWSATSYKISKNTHFCTKWSWSVSQV